MVRLPSRVENDLHNEEGDTAWEEFDRLSREPPAWHGTTPAPSPPRPQPTPAPVMPPPPVFIPSPAPPQPPAGPPPFVPPIPTPGPIPPTNPAPPPVVTPPPVTTGWRAAVVGALQAVATSLPNTQFQAWANAPRDIYALVMSESAGNWIAVKNEGYSSKQGRDFYSFGLFQMNELFGYDRFKAGPSMIGASLAAKMVPFPSTATWTRDQAAVPLLHNPNQLWYAMVLLRGLSKIKNTYFDVVEGQTIQATTSTTKLPSEAERLKASQMATLIRSQASLLGISTSGVLTKAYWLASSPQGIINLTTKRDARLASYAVHWKNQ